MVDIPGGDEEQWTLRVTLKNLLSGEAEVVTSSLERMEEGAEDAARAGKVLEEQNERTAKSMAKEAAAAKAAGAATNDFGDEQIKAAIAGKMLERQNKKTHKGMLGYIKFGLRFNAVFSAYKIYLIADALQFVATAINGVGAAGIAAVNGLAPLSGLIFALPGGIAAALQSVSAFKVGLNGMGEGLKVLLDPEATAKEVHQAMKDLSPSARMVLITLAKLKDDWKDVRKETQEALMFGIAPTIQGLAQTYLPMLREGLRSTAAEWNTVLRDTGKWLQQSGTQQDIASVFGSNARVAGSMGRAGQAGLRMLLDVLVAAAPMVERMADDFEGLMDSLSNTLHGRRDAFSNWLNGVYDLWLKWWHAIKLYGKALYNVFKASSPLTKAMGEDLTEVGEKFLAWTESKRGQRMMRQWFTEMIPVVRELGNWIISIGDEWFNLTRGDNDSFIKTSQMLRKDLLPALIEFANTTANKFIPKLIELITLWVYSPTFPTDAFSSFLDILVKFSRAIIGFTNSLPPEWQHFISQLFALGLFLKIQPAFVLAFLKFPFRWVGSQMKTHLLANLQAMNWQTKLLRGAAGLGGVLMLMHQVGDDASGGEKAIEGLMDIAGAAMIGFAVGGPWGAAIGAAAGLVVSLVTAFQDQADAVDLAKLKVQDYTDTLNQNTGAITKNTVASVAKSLEESGALKIAGQLGIDSGLLVNASLGKKGALSELVGQLNQYILPAKWNKAREWVNQGFQPQTKADFEYMSAYRDWLKTSGWTQEQENLAIQLSDAAKITLNNIRGQAAAVRRVNRAIDSANGKREKEVEAVEKIEAAAKRTADHLERGARSAGRIITNGYQSVGVTGSTGYAFDPRVVYGSGPGYFKGGIPDLNKMSLVGEAGAEAFVSRLGKISLVGTHGPELRKFSTPGAIVPASATADPFRGATGNAPSWAVDALRKAYDGASSTSAQPWSARPSESGSVTQKHYHYHGGPVYPQTEMDVESAAERAWRKLHDEAGERD